MGDLTLVNVDKISRKLRDYVGKQQQPQTDIGANNA